MEYRIHCGRAAAWYDTYPYLYALSGWCVGFAYENLYHKLLEYILCDHGKDSRPVFREDIVTNGDGHEDALANAPERKGRSFAAPKTFAPQGTGGDA